MTSWLSSGSSNAGAPTGDHLHLSKHTGETGAAQARLHVVRADPGKVHPPLVPLSLPYRPDIEQEDHSSTLVPQE